MRIAHLDTGRGWRGGQAQVLGLSRGLAERGHEVLLLAPPGPLLERARAAGVRAVRWSARGEWDVGALFAAARLLAGFRAEVAHCHSAHAHALGVPAARRARVPAVFVSRRVDFAVGGNPLSWLKYRMPVDRYLCISRGVLEVLRRAGVPESRLALVPSGIEFPEPDLARAADLRGLIGAPAGAPVVGTVAALAPHKDHATLLEAAAIVRRERDDVHFAWVGEGECRPTLERRRAALGLGSRVHLLGFRTDAHALLAQFTLFALSSHLEGMCTSLLDAQALGVPVVATRVGGVPDVVEDGVSGRLVPERDPQALAGALLEALRAPRERERWVDGARRSVERFRIANTVEGTLEQYRQVLAARGAHRA